MTTKEKPKVKILPFLKPYTKLLFFLITLTILANGLSLFIPRLIGNVIDQYQKSPGADLTPNFVTLGLITLGIVVFTISQIVLIAYASEKVARDLRLNLSKKIASQSNGYVSRVGASDLLTNLTSDVDSVKVLVSQGIVNIFSAGITLIGSVYLLLSINLKLGLIALAILPLIGIAFRIIFSQIGQYFRAIQENLGRINKVINESVVGAMLVRVLNSQKDEQQKFEKVNLVSRDLGYKIINLFSALIPVINLVSNIAIVIILWFGGQQVIEKNLTLGEFSAFISYYGLLITPFFIIGFISNLITRSLISLGRVNAVLDAPVEQINNQGIDLVTKKISGKLEFKAINMEIKGKKILDNISFTISPKTRNAIVGPTAAGKSQIFSLITSLTSPTSGEILVDDTEISTFDKNSLFSQLGLVFQDSIIFNSTLRENIQFSEQISDSDLQKAIDTANLDDLIKSLPNGLESQISERGSNLSGGQKQRLMLARALALNPKILLLDDFTARVDINTEKKILQDLTKNYPDLTLISITQKIEPIEGYDQILLLMQGELLASGTHKELMQSSLEYQQIWESQQSAE